MRVSFETTMYYLKAKNPGEEIMLARIVIINAEAETKQQSSIFQQIINTRGIVYVHIRTSGYLHSTIYADARSGKAQCFLRLLRLARIRYNSAKWLRAHAS